MNPPGLAFRKGRDITGHSIQSWTRNSKQSKIQLRSFAAAAEKKDGSQSSIPHNLPNGRDKKLDDREFFMSVLGSTATKRDARSYLRNFTPPEDSEVKTEAVSTTDTAARPPSKGCGVNLGSFYGKPRAVDESPKFIQGEQKAPIKVTAPSPLHLALVKIKSPQNLSDDTLHGVGRTLTQLGKLGLVSCVVLDCDDDVEASKNTTGLAWRDLASTQADRLVTAIDAHGEPGARRMDHLIAVPENENGDRQTGEGDGRIHVTHRKLLLTPLRRGMIPVIPSVGYGTTTQKIVRVKADETIHALARDLAGLQHMHSPDENPMTIAEQIKALRNEVSLDRIIILDPVGAIPSRTRPDALHVFINLEQEYGEVKRELLESPQDISSLSTLQSGDGILKNGQTHAQNLDLVRELLSQLPPTTSALITTPEDAAHSGTSPDTSSGAADVRTRRQRNPLIHNLLTDKPIVSSSLPPGRLGSSTSIPNITPPRGPRSERIRTTFVKRGMSVTMFPDPRITPWEPPMPGQPRLSLTDSHIDLPRLVHLIEDSFDRKLDVNDYLARVNNRIAGVIIAGSYEGGALLTWELPPGVPDDGSEASRARMVPYLDKFAVLKRSQGAGGVADVVFSAMVRTCFPNGVIWRSRKDNPVNKWYFERSRGTWKLSDSNWTMFWTTPDVEVGGEAFRYYERVCRAVVPSWGDGKRVVD